MAQEKGATLESPLKTSVEIKGSLEELEAHIQDEIKKHKVLGLSIAIIGNNETLYAKAFGLGSVWGRKPVGVDTIFQAASISKPITAYAALRLVENGLLSLDEPLNNCLIEPYLPNEEAANTITLRMVLSHTAGLRNDPSGKDRKVYFTPGTCFSYSGGGFRYLQQVIEDIVGAPFEVFIQDELLEPLGMNSSTFVHKNSLQGRLAGGQFNFWRFGLPLPVMKLKANAAYSLLSTPTDISRFVIELLHPTLLQEETVRKMVTQAVRVNETVSWGLGIGLQHSPVGNALWHWGSNMQVYHSLMVAFQESSTGVVIMTNSASGSRVLKSIAHNAIGGAHYSYWEGLPIK
jgi:CubicO group peptidase (beta-lactamase class C family)